MALLLFVSEARALTVMLPRAEEHVVGVIYHVTVDAGQTLLDLARLHDIGYQEIVRANPGIDPWLPTPGERVVIPAQFILPSGPREGIVVNLPEMRLYYYPPADPGEMPVVITYPIGIGAEGRATPVGMTRVIAKAMDPPWVVPGSILAEHVAEGSPLPPVVAPGPDNPLGRHALRLGFGSYLIHGTNRPAGIGMRVSHGCLRMYPEDIATLFDLVALGTSVRLVNEPYKAGWRGLQLYIEAHPPLDDREYAQALSPGSLLVQSMLQVSQQRFGPEVWEQAARVRRAANGVPTAIYEAGQREAEVVDEAAMPG